MNKPLITLQDINTLARPCTADEDIANAFIAEAQREDIRHRLGDTLYLQLDDAKEQSPVRFLRDGGVWTDSHERQHMLVGVKTALAYYALARITRDGNIQASRYGAVVKDSDYSTEAESQERNRQYRELFAQADAYMAECLAYIEAHPSDFPSYTTTCTRSAVNNRMTIRVIKKI